MPAIVIKDYHWRQTCEYVIVQVSFKNRCPKNVDLLVVNNYMKANAAPFILELFLWESVNEEDSKCTIGENEMIFTLKKGIGGLEWPSLESINLDKDTKRERRLSALEQARILNEQRLKSKSERRHFLQKQAVRAQIYLDTSTLNKIQFVRDSCRKQAMQELDEWSAKSERPFLNEEKRIVQENRISYKKPLKWFNDESEKTKQKSHNDEVNEHHSSKVDKTDQAISEVNVESVAAKREDFSDKKLINCNTEILYQDSSEIWDGFDSDEEDQKGKKYSGSKIHNKIGMGKALEKHSNSDTAKKKIPLPRKNGTIDVSFTERVFPTPSRESKRVEEEEWLEKQAEARRKTGFVTEDLTPDEQDPQWLRDKGDEFFNAGNYLGAISAYTHGIKLSDKMATLYVNRSAAHYAVSNYHRCIDDTSKALELLTPQCEANKELRARCYARRGAALCKLSAPQHGIPELEHALTLLPDDEGIKQDLLTVKQHFKLKD